MAPPAEILLLDDELTVRHGIDLVLRAAGLRIAGLGSTAAEAAGLLSRRRFDAALVPAALGGAPTAPMLAGLLAERPGLPVVVHAGHDTVALRDAAAIGVPGLVLRASPPEVLLDALAAVIAGGRFVDPAVAARMPEPRARPARRGVALLSPREREVLGLLARGRTGSEIADELFLSAETVRTHVRNAVAKLGARTRTQAVALLVDHDGGVGVGDGTAPARGRPAPGAGPAARPRDASEYDPGRP